MQRMDCRMKPVSDKKCLLVSEVWPADEELSHTFRRGFVPLSGLQGGGGCRIWPCGSHTSVAKRSCVRVNNSRGVSPHCSSLSSLCLPITLGNATLSSPRLSRCCPTQPLAHAASSFIPRPLFRCAQTGRASKWRPNLKEMFGSISSTISPKSFKPTCESGGQTAQ